MEPEGLANLAASDQGKESQDLGHGGPANAAYDAKFIPESPSLAASLTTSHTWVMTDADESRLAPRFEHSWM